jgi:recombination protein RecR
MFVKYVKASDISLKLNNMEFPQNLAKLIDNLAKLPGIGPKSAQRIAYYLITEPNGVAVSLGNAILMAKEKTRYCESCFNFTEDRFCQICSDPNRDKTLLCVVEEPKDIFLVEKTNEFHGLYHVLGGALSPLEGIGPEKLNIAALENKVAAGDFQEIIICTNPNLEGETTANYLFKLLNNYVNNISKPARGIPMGADLEYADGLTLSRAFEGRSKMNIEV